MSIFKLHELSSAPEKSREILEKIKKKYGFIPNLYNIMAESPAALKSYTLLSQNISEGILTTVEKNIVLLSVSVENGCTYCTAVHSITSKMEKIDDETIQNLRDNKPVSNERYESLHQIAKSVVNKRGRLLKDEIESFLESGYTKQHLLEIITIVSMKTISNYINHIADTPLDDKFKSQAWSGNK